MSGSSLRRVLYTSAYGTAWVSGVFCIIVFGFLMANLMRTEAVAPLDSPELASLKELLQDNPENSAIAEQVRALDLLARRAFFTSRAFARSGAWLLLAGSITLLISLKTVSAFREVAVPPDRQPSGPAPAVEAAIARRGVAGLGVLLVLTAVLLIFYADRPVGDAEMESPAWAEFEQQWPSFRGPGGIGVAGTGGAPLHWDASSGQGIRWKTKVPRPGFSSPVVWGDRVYLSGGDEEALEVFCFDEDSGALRWRYGVEYTGELPEVLEETGYAAPSPATDGQRVFALFATGDLVALDQDGKQLWARNLGVPENSYGHSSSLLLYRDLLFVQYDQSDRARLIAVRAGSGMTAWERVREVDPCWASPVLIQHQDRASVVLTGTPLVSAFDPVTGELQWEVDCMGGEIAPSPTYDNGLVYVANEYPRLAALDAVTGEMKWEHEDDLPDVPSPVAAEGLVFMVGSDGYMTCLDGATGEVRWQHEFDVEVYSSPVVADGRVYLLDRDGTMHIFKVTGDGFESIAESSIGEASTCTVAITGSRIYLRGMDHLFCIEGGESP